jgi:site-specific DNA-methyltransferase (adenine-specific)
MRRELAAARNSDAGLTTADITARRHEAAAGEAWAMVKEELAAKGIKADEWCRKNLDVTARSMDRRLFLFKHWKLYESARRDQEDGLYGMVYAVALVRQELAKTATKRQPLSNRFEVGSEHAATLDISKCDFRTGDALKVLRTLPADSANVCVTSPPYFGGVRDYGHGHQIGHETTPADFLKRLTAIFREVQRVLRSDGVLWVVIGDSYSATRSAGQSPKNLLMIPAQLGIALQADGWVLRCEIVWDKFSGRPEPVTDRPTKSHDTILMLCKSAKGYHYDADAIHEPMTTVPHASRDLVRPGVMRRETQADYLRIRGNAELGRNARTVWRITPAHYRGRHSATFPPDLVRRCLLASCPPNGVVLDCFGGAGTTALVALQLGHRAITIDLNPKFTAEAKDRIADATMSAVTGKIEDGGSVLPGNDQDEEIPSWDPHKDRPANANAQVLAGKIEGRRFGVAGIDRDKDSATSREHAERLAAELDRICRRFRYRSDVLQTYWEETGETPAALIDAAD